MSQVSTNEAPKAIGAYSQAIDIHHFVFVSGQLGVDPATGELVEGGIEAETAMALKNLGAILEAAQSGPAQVIKTTCYLADLADFDAFNAEYAKFFATHPARECVQVAALPKGGRVEISAIAVHKNESIW